MDGLRVAMRRSILQRRVPILVSVLSAGLALMPLARVRGKADSEPQTPTALAMLWGLCGPADRRAAPAKFRVPARHGWCRMARRGVSR